VATGFFASLFGLSVYYWHINRNFGPFAMRIFQEKPLFIVPRGQPVADAEEVRFGTTDGLTLCGCYLRCKAVPRRGVILFGLEYGSNRWSSVAYCDFLRDHGFDIFAFEPRCQGDSDSMVGYEPLQWVTQHEVADFQSALKYLKTRLDADPRGVGFFGISKGAAAGLLAAVSEVGVRCFVTDGVFATHTTMLPYMRKWVAIYSHHYFIQRLLPDWCFGVFAKATLRRMRREKGLRFPHLEQALPQLAGRPLLMIHGGGDTYIKPAMAKALYELAGEPRDFWLVEGAKHNQALQVANGDYQKRVLEFFERHLAPDVSPPSPTSPLTQEPLAKIAVPPAKRLELATH
jgi:pimeloyl-ACP methyl ester carboxylesterase